MALVPTTQALERAVRAYVAEGSGLEGSHCIPGNEKAPAPKELYASVLLIDEHPHGTTWDRPRRTNELTSLEGEPTGDLDVYESNTVRYSVQWYREGARDAGRRFKLWARSPIGRDGASKRGLTFMGYSDLRRLDAIEDTGYEERVGLDLEIGIVTTYREEPGHVETARIDVALDAAGNPTATVAVDVDVAP